MDGDLNAILQSVLSDPAQMAKITDLAQGLMGGGEQKTAPEKETPDVFSPTETSLLTALGKSLGGSGGGGSRSTALLAAMRPYMKPEKQEKLDRAVKMTQMVRVVQTVMQQMGGGHGGI